MSGLFELKVFLADAETLAPGWPRATVGLDGSRTRLDPDPVLCQKDSSPSDQDTKDPSTTTGIIDQCYYEWEMRWSLLLQGR